MLSKVLGVIFSIEAFPLRTELKLLHKNSILVWSVDHNLRMPIHHHCSSVVTIISSSASSSMQRHRQRKTRSHGDWTSILVPLLPVMTAHVKRKKMKSAPSRTLMASSHTSWYKVPKWIILIMMLILMKPQLLQGRRSQRKLRLQHQLHLQKRHM